MNLRIPFIRKSKKLQKNCKSLLGMSPQPVNQNEKKVKGKAIARIRKRMKEDMQEKKVAQYRMANGKGNNILRKVKVVP